MNPLVRFLMEAFPWAFTMKGATILGFVGLALHGLLLAYLLTF